MFADSEDSLEDLHIPTGYSIINLKLPENALITPKTEMNRFLHDQFPYIADGSINNLPFNYPPHPSDLDGISNPTV